MFFQYHTTAGRSYSPRFVDLFGPPRHRYEPIDLESAEGRRYADCAASVQRVLEDTLVDIARALRRDTGLPDLCFGGGVALNGLANARILGSPDSSACSFRRARRRRLRAGRGAVRGPRYFGNPDREVPDHPFWGPPVDAADLARAAREDAQDVDELDDPPARRTRRRRSCRRPHRRWMDGASEFGPRALGHRSILAAPHSREMRDRLNRDIKHREEFRPFAPVVPFEVADRYFELPPGGARLARFMSGVFPVRPEWRGRSPP